MALDVVLAQDPVLRGRFNTYLRLGGLDKDVVVGWRRCGVFPEQSAFGELLVDLLSHRDVRQQHELLHHGVGVSEKMFKKRSAHYTETVVKHSFLIKLLNSELTLALWSGGL